MSTEKRNSTWNEFAKIALATARMLGQQDDNKSLRFWDADMASEYTRALQHRCQPERAIAELRRIAAEENRFPAIAEIVDACLGPRAGPRYITFTRDVIGKGAVTYARKVPNDGSTAESHLMRGETLVDDTAATRHYQRLTPAMRAEILQAFVGAQALKTGDSPGAAAASNK